MYKLLAFFAFLALAFAAPAPEPGAAIVAPALAYRSPVALPAYPYPAIPGAPLAFGAPVITYPYGAPLKIY